MSAAHTSGPWEAKVYGGWDTPRVWSNDGSIAMLQHHENSPSEAEANARLMAAAPELLQAMQDLLVLYQRKRPGLWGASLDQVKAAKAAIQKATGEV